MSGEVGGESSSISPEVWDAARGPPLVPLNHNLNAAFRPFHTTWDAKLHPDVQNEAFHCVYAAAGHSLHLPVCHLCTGHFPGHIWPFQQPCEAGPAILRRRAWTHSRLHG
jgi:hypothetical protein